jgi:hypothetical protein
MKLSAAFVLSFVFLLSGIAIAQQTPGTAPKVLVITREFVKPGRGGIAHEQVENEYVQAFARAKWPIHYVGMNSLSGKSRALFFTGYDSFQAWESDSLAIQKDPKLSAAIDHTGFLDGDLLESNDASVFMYREDYSLNPDASLPHKRYFEITAVHLRQGHNKEWDDAVKTVIAAYQKSNPEMHWACYEASYGMPEGTYIFITSRSTLAEVDQDFAKEKDFMSALGDDGMKKLEEVSAAAIESSETQLFAIDPRMSYVGDDVAAADPGFWNPKPVSAAPSHKKAAPKSK